MAEDAHRTRLLQYIHDLRPDYEEASRATEAYGSMLPDLYAVWKEMSRYQPDDPPHKAVYILAKCQTLIEGPASDYAAIDAWNEAHRRLEEYDRRKEIEGNG
jgi:hypothetical protein